MEATVAHILSDAPYSKFDVQGRVTFQDPQETINSNGFMAMRHKKIRIIENLQHIKYGKEHIQGCSIHYIDQRFHHQNV